MWYSLVVYLRHTTHNTIITLCAVLCCGVQEPADIEVYGEGPKHNVKGWGRHTQGQGEHNLYYVSISIYMYMYIYITLCMYACMHFHDTVCICTYT